MSNKEERKAPVLRFKGFTDDWEQRKLGDIANVYDGTHTTPDYQKNGIMFLSVENIDTLTSNKFITKSDYLDNYKHKPEYHDIFMTRIGSIGKTNILETHDPRAFYVSLALIKPKDIDPYYLKYWLSSNTTQKEIWRRTLQIAFPQKINKNEISKVQSSISKSKNEQYNMGQLLNKIDHLLLLQQRKLDQLKQLKKAYLSDLFSIKNKPQIRFKGFKGKWKKSKLLDNVSNIIDFRGKTPKKLGMDWSDQGILALSALNVKDSFIDKSIHAHYGDIKLYNKWMAGNKLHKGQVLFTTEAPMGNVAQVPDNDKYILSQRTIAFNVNKDKISDSFLAMLLQTTTVHNQLLSLSSGGTAKGVSQKSLSGLSVVIPLSLEEQRKMEMAFKYINHLIHFQQDKIRYLEENKQFLLQNMFI